MKAEPKMHFDSERDMFLCLKEWQARLGLRDWKIFARLCGREEMSNKDWAGESNVQHANRYGTISILRAEDIPEDAMIKQPQEETLIHELLHFHFPSFEEESREEAVYEMMQHQIIQTIAHALYMAKYDIGEEWFIPEGSRYGGGTRKNPTPEEGERMRVGGPGGPGTCGGGL